MKKLFYSFFAAAALMLSATSCSQEEMIQNETTTGDEVVATFNLEMEGQTASRAIADGLTVDQLFLAVYDENGNEIEALRQDEKHNNYVTVNNLGAVAKVRLVKGQTYQFVFWAQKKEGKHYDTSDLKKIKVNPTSADNSYYVLNNDESRDAFYAYQEPIKVTGSFKKNITLKRPFAQLNLGTTKEDLNWAKTAGIEVAKSSVTVEGEVYSELNTFTGYCSAPVKAELELTLNEIPDMEKELLTIKDSEDQFKIDKYYYLSTSYLLVPAKETLSKEIVFTLKGEKADGSEYDINTLTVSNAPLQRNWRTNIIGEILTGEGIFNIVIDPIPEGDRNYPMDGSELDIWDGKETTPEQNAAGEYVIDQASDLIGLATMDEDKLVGATFVLTKDLSFKNVETGKDTKPATIKPLFTENNEKGAMSITFKGNDHVIRDFVVEDKTNFSSLFGILTTATIENLTIVNADVTGHQNEHANAAVLIAKAFGRIILNNVTVKDSKLKAVQKVGGLIGYSGDNTNSEIVNCTVQNLTVESIDMKDESGATGGLIGHINEGNIKINNSYVKNSTFDLIQSVNEAKRANSEFIGVINGTEKSKSVTEITNCGVENNQFTNSIDWTLYNDPFVGGNRGGKYATLIVNGKTACATIDEVANALNAGKDVTLGANIEAEKALHINSAVEVVIDLNGHTISAGDNYNASPKGLIRVDGGATVTIKNGTVDSSTYTGDISAVTIPNGTLIIESGTFMTGDDSYENNSVIMAASGTQVIINGGTFEYKGTYQPKGFLQTLNSPNFVTEPAITVNGGTFYRFIPGVKNFESGDPNNFEHVLGEGKKVYKNNETTPTTDTTPEDGAWYTVK